MQRNFLVFKCPLESPADLLNPPKTNFGLHNAAGARDTGCRAGMISAVYPNLIGQRCHVEEKGAQYVNDVINAFPIGS